MELIIHWRMADMNYGATEKKCILIVFSIVKENNMLQ